MTHSSSHSIFVALLIHLLVPGIVCVVNATKALMSSVPTPNRQAVSIAALFWVGLDPVLKPSVLWLDQPNTWFLITKEFLPISNLMNYLIRQRLMGAIMLDKDSIYLSGIQSQLI